MITTSTEARAVATLLGYLLPDARHAIYRHEPVPSADEAGAALRTLVASAENRIAVTLAADLEDHWDKWVAARAASVEVTLPEPDGWTTDAEDDPDRAPWWRLRSPHVSETDWIRGGRSPEVNGWEIHPADLHDVEADALAFVAAVRSAREAQQRPTGTGGAG